MRKQKRRSCPHHYPAQAGLTTTVAVVPLLFSLPDAAHDTEPRVVEPGRRAACVLVAVVAAGLQRNQQPATDRAAHVKARPEATLQHVIEQQIARTANSSYFLPTLMRPAKRSLVNFMHKGPSPWFRFAGVHVRVQMRWLYQERQPRLTSCI